MEAKLAFVDCLLKLERRVYRIYEAWADNENFSTELRAFWRDMADDEKEHITILEHSAGLLNFATVPRSASGAQMARIEKAISRAEHATHEMTVDGALSYALALENSEINGVDDAWLRSFKPDLANLTKAWVPAHEQHLRRLSDAIRKFSRKENLHKQAAVLLSAYGSENKQGGQL